MDGTTSVEKLLDATEATVVYLQNDGDSDSRRQGTGECSLYARDPYVARPVNEEQQSSSPPVQKTIEEILQSISGYQVQPETADKKNTMNSSPDLNLDKLERLDPGQLELDVMNFRDFEPPSAPVGSPQPIRNAYELDADYFETLAATIKSSDYRHSQIGQEKTTATNTVGSSLTTSDAAATTGCFWAQAGDVIRVDGKQGFGHIDLACFDVSKATFQGNQIQIACDDGTAFQVDYRNVSHALFANGVEVELAAYEMDFERG